MSCTCIAEIQCTGAEEFGATLLNPCVKKVTVSLGPAEYPMSAELTCALEAYLKLVYEDEYPSQIQMPWTITKYKRLDLFGRTIGSGLWNDGKGKYILSRFSRRPRRRGQNDRVIGTMWPGYVRFFFSVDMIMINSNRERRTQTHRFAYCAWFRPRKHALELSDTVWQNAVFCDRYSDAILPLYAIASEFIPAPIGNSGDFCVLVLPNQITIWSPNEYEYNDDL